MLIAVYIKSRVTSEARWQSLRRAGFSPDSPRNRRRKANYLRCLHRFRSAVQPTPINQCEIYLDYLRLKARKNGGKRGNYSCERMGRGEPAPTSCIASGSSKRQKCKTTHVRTHIHIHVCVHLCIHEASLTVTP